jgi:hypothetical protein
MLFGGKMQYRNLTNLSSLIRANIHRVNRMPEIDVIAGIPRSGMIAAAQIATLTNKPLASVGELLETAWRVPRHGGRWRTPPPISTILLVDDSISGGQTMSRVRESLLEIYPGRRIIHFAVFRKESSPSFDLADDIWLETVPGPRVFEWNWNRHPFVKNAVLDIDGVISTPTKPGWREQGYPLWIPKHQVLALATGRWEDDRKPTEEWLAKHGVQYSKLYMSGPEQKAHTTKVKAMIETGATWMVESNVKQAQYIRMRTGRPVLCTDTNTMMDV